MSESSPLARCPACGAATPARAPEGLCPKCLFLEAAGPTEAGDGRERPVAPALDMVAAAFPQLEILELIGQGGMGCVFKARQPQLNRFVALKILPEALARDTAFASRFTTEAQALASLSHPNIVTIHDFGQANGFFYLLMEFVDGVNLRQALRAGRFTPGQALAIVPPICDALQFAHERGIVHRDIKPENLLLDKSGQVKIADFGIAKMVGDEGARDSPEAQPQQAGESQATATGRADPAAGTPQYMAPEQRDNPQRADHRADIYSLGVVLYELLTGELPGARLQPPSRKVQIDVRLDEVVLRALEVKPELRYATAAEFRTQLESVPVGERTSGAAPPAFGAADPWLAPAIGLVLFFAGLVAGNLLVDALPVYRHSASLLVAALMFCAAPVIGILTANSLRRRLACDEAATNESARSWLNGLGWTAFVLAIPAIGFGGFFLLALVNGRGPWNPAASEVILVPLTWIGSILLPLAGWKLRTAGTIPRPFLTGPTGPSPWLRFLAVSLFSVAAIGLALVVGWLTLRHSQGAATRVEPAQAGPQGATDQEQSVDSVPPVVVRTEPASGALDVAPGLTEIRVKFSKPMVDRSWSWTTAWQDSDPGIIEGPRYETDRRTCVIKVDLEPGRTYAYWLNSSRYRNFKDRNGNPAVPYLLIFRTRNAENPF